MLERALAICETGHGTDRPDTALTLHNLAGVLADQGDIDGARRPYERALAIREARLGTDHPDTAESRKRAVALAAESGTPSFDQPHGGSHFSRPQAIPSSHSQLSESGRFRTVAHCPQSPPSTPAAASCARHGDGKVAYLPCTAVLTRIGWRVERDEGGHRDGDGWLVRSRGAAIQA